MAPRALLAHLSDPHIDHARPEKAEALRAAVRFLLALPMRPDAVLITGDLTDHGRPDEYEAFARITADLPMPLLVLPGNHDDRAEMLRRFPTPASSLPGFMQYAAEVGPLRVLALDTHVPGQGGGRLDAARLAWLDERLGEQPARPTLVALHHPPLTSGVAVMDAIGLEGARELEAVLARHPQVERVLAGHTHMTQTRRYAGTLLTVCPGTDAALLPDPTHPEKFVVQTQPPALLLHEWQEGAGLTTYTTPVLDAPFVTLHDGERWL